ncbi:phenylalanine--tRNA ligase subunit alpha [Candidatus Paracaedibacter symbiosus]|uniref:phenylalanine--tRNA ligase subunit alpha n=1 Tax=Candidatus Paracaedibacter symbiosus TaxID=244582 RepID=UPI000509A1CD|nr:phenylalanine--tRNA ligase subunit alpha [Candidatus Paracaedibacter symbiosus]
MSQDLNHWQQQIAACQSLKQLDDLRVHLIGKTGVITGLLKGLGALSFEERREKGAEINQLKDSVQALLEVKKTDLVEFELQQRLKHESVDVTLSPRPEHLGTIHPVSRTIDEIVAYFSQFGFTVATGPDIEDEEHNFNALNIPAHHPARQSHDTFYLPNQDGIVKLLRTHTSPVQIRTMKNESLPLRILAPGRTYRCDHDATHTPMFHQIEGLVIEKNIHMGHLKSCLIDFCRHFFEVDKLPVRFRPSFFPFTEPSAEMDIGCDRSNGTMKIGEGRDWLEILGCGMVHPNVLKNCGIDSDVYQGFAFGMGVERVAMLKYGIPDIRLFYESDTRWLSHYGFSPFTGS